MAVCYNNLWKLLIDKGLKKTDLIYLSGISSNVLAKLGKNETVSMESLEKICLSLECKIENIIEFVDNKTDASQSINSPFRYAGGKFYARKLISEHLIESDVYCEPFAGGASVFFYKTKSKVNILNDLDNDLMLVYKTIRDYPQELIEILSHFQEPSKESHNYYKNIYIPANDIEKAARWFYLNRISYSGIMQNQNCYFGYGEKYSMRPENWPRNILRTSEKLQNVDLRATDAIECIHSLPDNSLVFVDPPYFNADQDKFYTCSFTQEDHIRLCDAIKTEKDRLRIFITYDNCEEIRNMYSFMPYMYDKEWNYCISRTDDQKEHKRLEDGYKGKRQKGKELFILNY